MTAPTPPPGWHPDPDGSNQLRWWDGQQWTDQYQPSPVSTSAGEKVSMGRGKKIAIGAAVVFVGLIIVGLIGNALSPDKDKGKAAENAAASSSTTTKSTSATPTATPQVVVPTATPTPANTTSSAPRPTRPTTPKPPGCEAAPEQYLTAINGAFEDGYSLINTSAYQAGDTLYIAGEIAKANGDIRSRDDVFAVKDNVITPVTSTARHESTLPDLRRVLDVSVLDGGAQRAMDCARTY